MFSVIDFLDKLHLFPYCLFRSQSLIAVFIISTFLTIFLSGPSNILLFFGLFNTYTQFLAIFFVVLIHAYMFDEQILIEMKPRPMKKRSGVIAGIGDAGGKETTLGNGDDKGEVSLDLLVSPHLIIVLRFLSMT